MPMTKSRQIKQPQSTILFEYYLLHKGNNDSPSYMNLVRTDPELFDFYKADIP